MVNTIKRDRIIVIVTCFLSLEIVCWRDKAMSCKIIRSWANARLEPGAGLWERILFAFVPQHSHVILEARQRCSVSIVRIRRGTKLRTKRSVQVF